MLAVPPAAPKLVGPKRAAPPRRKKEVPTPPVPEPIDIHTDQIALDPALYELVVVHPHPPTPTDIEPIVVHHPHPASPAIDDPETPALDAPGISPPVPFALPSSPELDDVEAEEDLTEEEEELSLPPYSRSRARSLCQRIRSPCPVCPRLTPRVPEKGRQSSRRDLSLTFLFKIWTS